MNGWSCPKCGYVWAGWVRGCMNCNRPEHEKYKYTTGTDWAVGKDRSIETNPKSKGDTANE